MRLIPARSSAFPLAIAVAAFAFLGLFLIYPLLNVFAASFLDRTGTTFTFANYVKILSTGFYRQSLWNTLGLGLLTAGFSVLFAVPIAFCLARLRIPGKGLLFALAILPLVLPSFVGAYAWVLLLGRVGLVTQALQAVGVPFGSIYGMGGLVFVMVLHSFPYVLMPTLAALKAVDISMEEAGQNLGATRWRAFRTVVLPIAIPSVLSGALLVFMETIENFGVPFVLAEDMPVLAVEAYKLFAGELGGNPASAGVLAVMLVVCTTTALLLQRGYLARRRFATGARAAPPELRTGRAVRIAAAA